MAGVQGGHRCSCCHRWTRRRRRHAAGVTDDRCQRCTILGYSPGVAVRSERAVCSAPAPVVVPPSPAPGVQGGLL